MFTLDDTIRVLGVKGTHKEGGIAYDATKEIVPELVLCVCGRDNTTQMPVVYAVNGNKNSDNLPIWVPAIPKGSTIFIRLTIWGHRAGPTGCSGRRNRMETIK